ncbi:MAG: hypothetical protein J7K96_09945 [Desulfobacteraceae bacterium]|nr:hypothetical protein [Desulfobacteraceae bacterium]
MFDILVFPRSVGMHKSFQYTSRFESSRIQKMHPVCREFFQKIHAIAKDKNILKWFKNREQL